MRWQLVLEKYGPDLIWLKGSKNQAADTLSRLPYMENDTKENEYSLLELAELYGVEDIPDEAFSLMYKYLQKGQGSDQSLLRAANKKDSPYTSKVFFGGSKAHILVVYNNKIVIPGAMKKRTITWYHEYLLHLGIT